jgi:hypothetical protein
MRAAETTPMLDRIGARLAELEKRVLPKSLTCPRFLVQES